MIFCQCWELIGRQHPYERKLVMKQQCNWLSETPLSKSGQNWSLSQQYIPRFYQWQASTPVQSCCINILWVTVLVRVHKDKKLFAHSKYCISTVCNANICSKWSKLKKLLCSVLVSLLAHQNTRLRRMLNNKQLFEMQENLLNLLEKIYISTPGACDSAVSPALWHRDPSSVKSCVTKTGDRHGRGEPQSCSRDCTAICLMNPPVQDKERPIYAKLHQASVESSKTTWHACGPLADLPLSPDKVEQNKILEERVGKERKQREQLTRQKASEKSLWLLYDTTLRITFPHCIMLNPLFFIITLKTLHFRLVALVSQSVF